MSPITKVAIIGSGISGLSAAYHLRSPSLEANLFDKGTNPGGRMATRADRHDPTLSFEHGLQHIAPSAHTRLSRCSISGSLKACSPLTQTSQGA